MAQAVIQHGRLSQQRDAKRQRQEQISELQVEIDGPTMLLKNERQELQRKKCRRRWSEITLRSATSS
ncbi:hypothetical protein JOB18_040838 [Solea senegalensis]|uniref:Uncharacterized protein n=1 Tax=Solea senegalensis TaxID=28829 RepID=A0AAV6Q465_SOLSE|nr:hypothetical protein JOB18_040838 [Solea senegalensis]